jgi:hypothetical protein
MNDAFDRLNLETGALKAQMSDLERMAEGLGTRLVTAFAGAALEGRNLQDVLRGLGLSLSRMALSQALKPLGGLLGGIGGGVPFASGGVANSSVLSSITGGGSIGDAVLRTGQAVGNVVVNIATPDASSFQRSQSQVAALIARAAARGQRNL